MTIYEYDIAKLIITTKEEVAKKLKFLEKSEIVVYNPVKTLPQLTYLTPRLETSKLKRHYNLLKPRQAVIKEKIEAIIGYASNQKSCRTRIFQEYFDETAHLNCGVCDVCLKAKKEESWIEAMDDAKERILAAIKAEEMYIDELKEETEITDDFVFTEALRWLMDEEILKLEGFLRVKRK